MKKAFIGLHRSLDDRFAIVRLFAEAFGMEISTETSNITSDYTMRKHANTIMNDQQLKQVNKCKYPGAILTADGIISQKVKTNNKF